MEPGIDIQYADQQDLAKDKFQLKSVMAIRDDPKIAQVLRFVNDDYLPAVFPLPEERHLPAWQAFPSVDLGEEFDLLEAQLKDLLRTMSESEPLRKSAPRPSTQGLDEAQILLTGPESGLSGIERARGRTAAQRRLSDELARLAEEHAALASHHGALEDHFREVGSHWDSYWALRKAVLGSVPDDSPTDAVARVLLDGFELLLARFVRAEAWVRRCTVIQEDDTPCGRFFVQTGGYTRLYCSKRCNNRVNGPNAPDLLHANRHRT